MLPPILESSPLEEEVRTFCSIVEVAMLDPSAIVRSLFQHHLIDRYPCVERLFSQGAHLYAAVRNANRLYQVPVMPVPKEYLGERPMPTDVDLTKLLQ